MWRDLYVYDMVRESPSPATGIVGNYGIEAVSLAPRTALAVTGADGVAA
jgi:hypothetical protein